MKIALEKDPIWEVEDRERFADEFMKERARKIRANTARRLGELGMTPKELVMEIVSDRDTWRGVAHLAKGADIVVIGKMARVLGLTYHQITS